MLVNYEVLTIGKEPAKLQQDKNTNSIMMSDDEDPENLQTSSHSARDEISDQQSEKYQILLLS